MNRRELLTTLSVSVGGSLLLPNVLASCRSDEYVATFFETKDISLINQIGETILPATPESGGAAAAKVAYFIDFFAQKGLAPEEQALLKESIPKFKEYVKTSAGKSFLRLDAEIQHDLLVELDDKSKRLAATNGEKHYFQLLKELVLFAYFTSETGMTEAMRYVAIPGKFEGDYPYEKGEGAWAL